MDLENTKICSLGALYKGDRVEYLAESLCFVLRTTFCCFYIVRSVNSALYLFVVSTSFFLFSCMQAYDFGRHYER